MNDSASIHWRLDTDADGIAWLHFNKADGSTNVLSSATLAELEVHLSAINEQRPRGLSRAERFQVCPDASRQFCA